jgi:SHAQKYF class myb-like DNA-binding protein
MKDESNNQKGGAPALTEENSNQGRWTDEEHEKFLDALKIYGKNWNKVHRHVGTRTSAQTRSHAQKYFNKLMKKGSKEGNHEFMKKEDSSHSGSNKGQNFKSEQSYDGREISIDELLPTIKTGLDINDKMTPGESQAYGNLN